MINLPNLPFGYDALEPAMSAKTLRLHHDKHHAGYVSKTNDLATKAGLSSLSLEDLVVEARKQNMTALGNNAAQAWNHAFFWESIAPRAAGPSGLLSEAIDRSFGGLKALRAAFIDAGATHFGSGWLWLTHNDGLRVLTSHDADNLLHDPATKPLLVCDLWEHAYYLDYQNDRAAFLGRWFDTLANWDFARRQYLASRGRTVAYVYPTSTTQGVAENASA